MSTVLPLVLALCTAFDSTDIDSGTGWTRLDLKLAIWPERKEIAFEAMLALRLEADASRGPTILINAKNANMRFDEVTAARPGSTVQIGHPWIGHPPLDPPATRST